MPTSNVNFADLVLLQHHQESLGRMLDHLQSEPGLLAVILGGSVAKGMARPDSDLDAMVILTDEAYAARLERNAISDCIFGKCTYDNGYFDLKYFPIKYLLAAAERGSEPTRSSFLNARLLQSRRPEIDQSLLTRISTYPENEIPQKIRSFFSALSYATGYFWGEAQKRDIVFLRTRCAVDAVYFGLRLILVHNRRLFPCQKWLFDAVEHCSDKPEGVLDLARTFLRQADNDSMQAFANAINEFRDWGPIQKDPFGRLSTVVLDQEQWWLN